MMAKRIELLAPGGDVDSIKAAIAAGADAVYCGLDRFNARNRAENISYEQLLGILHLAHKRGCQVFLTLNIIVVEHELTPFTKLLNKLCNTSIDGIILQDLGMFYLVKKYFNTIPVHASTQLTTHNRGQVGFLGQLGVKRVNLSRELHLGEITELTERAHKNNSNNTHKIMTEVFVHGSNCLSFSGLCYMSSVLDGKSGNRGRCSQPCRDQYQKTVAGKEFPLNLKDNSAYAELDLLLRAGVDSLKIEGRIKKFHYVYTVVKSYRQQLERYYSKAQLLEKDENLYTVFNRNFTTGFLLHKIHQDMFIDNPRDNSALHLAKTLSGSKEEKIEKAKRQLYDYKTDIIADVHKIIDRMSLEKVPLTIALSGHEGSVLEVSLSAEDISTTITSSTLLKKGPKRDNTLNHSNFKKLLGYLGESNFYIENIQLDNLGDNLQLPFKELTTIKRAIFSCLHNSKNYHSPISLPRLEYRKTVAKPTLSVLISSKEDLGIAKGGREVYYELPACLENDFSQYIEIFKSSDHLIPWFPPVIIGNHFTYAVELLEQLKPTVIVTNNSGIAFEANTRNIPWIGGPFLNIANSYSLLCLKEEFNCVGAFISNELDYYQIKAIKKPDNFRLYYSIYHPITLMTSRQCLFHTVTDCDKDLPADSCLSGCQKSSTITNQKNESFFIIKEKGLYHSVYNSHNFLNSDIVLDMTNMFDSFSIDLRNIQTETKVPGNKEEIIHYFNNVLQGKDHSKEQLKQHILPTTDKQYEKGI